MVFTPAVPQFSELLSLSICNSIGSEDVPDGYEPAPVTKPKSTSSICTACFYTQRGSFGVSQVELEKQMGEHESVSDKHLVCKVVRPSCWHCLLDQFVYDLVAKCSLHIPPQVSSPLFSNQTWFMETYVIYKLHSRQMTSVDMFHSFTCQNLCFDMCAAIHSESYLFKRRFRFIKCNFVKSHICQVSLTTQGACPVYYH